MLQLQVEKRKDAVGMENKFGLQNLRVRAEDQKLEKLRGCWWPYTFALPLDSLIQRVNLLILVCFIFSPFFLLWVLVEGGIRFCINSGSYVDLKAD